MESSLATGSRIGSTEAEPRDGLLAFPQAGSALHEVTGELVSRLARRLPASERPLAPLIAMPALEETEAFATALIAPDPSESREAFHRLREAGATADTLTLGHMSAASHCLGAWWMADRCGFLEVTLGTARLHALLRDMRSDFAPTLRAVRPELKALFTPALGETHALGVTMAANFFRRAGWSVALETRPDAGALDRRLAETSYGVVGLSVGCEASVETLRDTIAQIRRAQPGATIVLGGSTIETDPGLTARVGADQSIADVRTAAISLQSLAKV